MTEDKLLKEFFSDELWQKVIDQGIDKTISKATLKALCDPENRLQLLDAILANQYTITPPHVAQIPKDTPGEFRTVYINEDMDRVFLTVANLMLFKTCGNMVHQSCKSYQEGIGTGKVVREVSQKIQETSHGNQVGFISDLSKYFDSVPIEWIDKIFDQIEEKHGESRIISILRVYYHSDWYFDLDENLVEGYQSLKQGCATASFLADALLYEIDKEMTLMTWNTPLINGMCFKDGIYVRYSDDILFIGHNYEQAFYKLSEMLNQMGLTLNPKKVKPIIDTEWFKFLGFNIKGSQITLAPKRIKKFQKEIMKRTIRNHDKKFNLATYETALSDVYYFLYKGYDGYSWATGVLGVMNVEKDIQALDKFVRDCLRFNLRGKRIHGKGDKLIGGLGIVNGVDYTIERGEGQWCKRNKELTELELPHYHTLQEMRNALIWNKELYNTIVRGME